MCHHFGSLLAGRVLDAREDRSQDAGEMAGLYTESWKNRLNRFKQFVRDPYGVRSVQVEKPVTGSEGTDKINCSLPNPGEAGNNTSAGAPSA